MKYWIFLLTLSLLPARSVGQQVSARAQEAPVSQQTSESQAAKSQLVISLRGNLLSVKVHNAPWEAVLKEIERQTGISIDVKGPLTGTLTGEFQSLPIERGLRQLFRHVDVFFFYATETREGITAEPLVRVWLCPKEGSVAEAGQGLPSFSATAEAKQALQPMMGEDQEARLAALVNLAQQGDEEALRKALSDWDQNVRERALELLAELDREATMALLLDMTKSPDAETRLQALSLLDETGFADEATVLPILGAALADEALRPHAVEALAGRGDPDAMIYLRQAMRDPDPHIRMMVIDSIAPEGQGLQWLREATSDADRQVRVLAASRLEQIVLQGAE